MLNKLNRTDQLILGIAGTLLIVFSYFLYNDTLLFQNSENNLNEQIGQVEKIQNDVRRKSQGTFSWAPTSDKQNVYHLDSVFTGNNSEASIKLNDGSIIHVRENSLITLSVKQGQLQLDLKYGDLVGDIKKDTDIQVKSGSEEYKLKGSNQDSSVVITRSRLGVNDVQSLKGKPDVLIKKTGKKLALKQAAPLKPINPEPLVKNEELKLAKPEPTQIQLVTKDNLLVQRINAIDPFNLEWKAKGEFEQFKIIVKKNITDPEIASQEKTKSLNLNFTTPLDEGKYYWKVIALDKSEKTLAESDFRSFQLYSMEPLLWIYPKTEDVIYNTPDDLKMSWSKSLTTDYQWQISKSDDFKVLVDQGHSTTNEVLVKKPQIGTYWARVRAQKGPESWNLWSQAVAFSISEAPQAPLAAPILNQKKFEVKITTANLRNPASIPMTHVTWQKVSNASSYLVQVSDHAHFAQAEQFETKDLSFDFKKYKKRKHYARVFAKSDKGKLSPSSDLALIKLELDKPVINNIKDIIEKSSDVNAQPQGQEVSLSWTQIPLTNHYRLELSQTKEFTSAEALDVKSENTQFKFDKPGVYFARVKPFDNTGEALTDYSDPIQFKYDFKKTLESPTLLEPFNQSTVFLQKDIEPFVWLEWKRIANPHVSKYEIQIAQDSDFNKIILAAQSENPRFLIKNKIPYGKVFWRVRALSEDSNLNSSWSSARVFSLIFKRNETFIK